MSSTKRFKRGNKRTRLAQSAPAESRLAETLTIAWTVSVTGVLIADLMLLGASLLVRRHAAAGQLRMLETVVLLLAGGAGAVSLGLLPIVWRRRVVKPPVGYTVFAVMIAAAPITVLVGRLFTL